VRLSRASLTQVCDGVSTPTYDARDLRPGVVHLGTGCFHRAHQAVYLDRIAELGVSRDWAVVGSGLRSARPGDELARQDGLYSLTTRGPSGTDRRVVGVMQGYHSVPAEGWAPLVRRIADPRTQLVTLTITAPSYAAAGPTAATATFEHLAVALGLRRRSGAGPLTVLSCDNLPDNGAVTRLRVLESAARRDPGLAAWIERHVSFPDSMVDRITPLVSREESRALGDLGPVRDAVAVASEEFTQWVVQDAFAGQRPPLQEVGVQLVTDVRPFGQAKMRLLNASHVAIGFVGARAGHRTTHAAMRDPAVAGLVTRMMRDEVGPLLESTPGLDLADYQRALVGRLASAALDDPVERLCRRGSVRVQNYVVPSLRAALDAGTPITALTTVVAAWISFLSDHRGPLAGLEDAYAPVLLPLAARAVDDVRPFLAAVPGLEELTGSARFVTTLQTALTPEEDHRAAS
jgi:mannitol-1-phosphate/altronate dehydrogenase